MRAFGRLWEPLGAFGRLLEPFRALGSLWEPLRESWGHVKLPGQSLDPLAKSLGTLGEVLATFGEVFGYLFGPFGEPLGTLGGHVKYRHQKYQKNLFPRGQNVSRIRNCHQFSHVAKSRESIQNRSCGGAAGGLPHIRGKPP